MNILLQFPTLGRPDKFVSCYSKYLELSSGKHNLKFNINCDIADPSMNNQIVVNAIKEKTEQYPHAEAKIHFDINTTKISAINDHISNEDFDVVVSLSDDMIPKKQNWDDIIASKLEECFPDTDGAIHLNDGLQGKNLITLSILGKKLYDRFGYIYHPDYKSLYCDNEFTEQVYALNKVVFIEEVIIAHEHFSAVGSINYGQHDYVTQTTIANVGRDAYVFERRKALGFPKDKITND